MKKYPCPIGALIAGVQVRWIPRRISGYRSAKRPAHRDLWIGEVRIPKGYDILADCMLQRAQRRRWVTEDEKADGVIDYEIVGERTFVCSCSLCTVQDKPHG